MLLWGWQILFHIFTIPLYVQTGVKETMKTAYILQASLILQQIGFIWQHIIVRIFFLSRAICLVLLQYVFLQKMFMNKISHFYYKSVIFFCVNICKWPSCQCIIKKNLLWEETIIYFRECCGAFWEIIYVKYSVTSRFIPY